MDRLNNVRIGFIGGGKMAQALSRGIISAGLLEPSKITVSDPNQNQVAHLQALKVNITASNIESVAQSNVVILAVKPHFIRTVLRETRQQLSEDHLVISIASGVSIQTIEEELQVTGLNIRVIRVLPNTPASVLCGASAFSTGSHATVDDAKLVQKLLSACGICEQLPEKHLDAVCGLSGSGPAYVFMAIDALADGGVKMGLPKATALKFAAQTMMGAAKMVLETGVHPAALKDAVCSPAGTTINAVSELERIGLRYALISAVEASAKRSVEQGAMERKNS